MFPPRLGLGQPKRHHAVVYMHMKLKPEFTVQALAPYITMDPGEVGACAWFDRTQVAAIVAAREGTDSQGATQICKDLQQFRYMDVY